MQHDDAPGAISLKEFESRLPNIKKDQPIISIAPDPMSIRLPVRQSDTWGWDIRMSRRFARCRGLEEGRV